MKKSTNSKIPIGWQPLHFWTRISIEKILWLREQQLLFNIKLRYYTPPWINRLLKNEFVRNLPIVDFELLISAAKDPISREFIIDNPQIALKILNDC